MKHYLFEDWDGEQFIVGANTLKEAIAEAKEYFNGHIRYLGKLTDEQAEMSGLDEY